MNKIPKTYLIIMLVLFILSVIVTTLILTGVFPYKILSLSFILVAGIQFVLAIFRKNNKMSYFTNIVIAVVLVISGLACLFIK